MVTWAEVLQVTHVVKRVPTDCGMYGDGGGSGRRAIVLEQHEPGADGMSVLEDY